MTSMILSRFRLLYTCNFHLQFYSRFAFTSQMNAMSCPNSLATRITAYLSGVYFMCDFVLSGSGHEITNKIATICHDSCRKENLNDIESHTKSHMKQKGHEKKDLGLCHRRLGLYRLGVTQLITGRDSSVDKMSQKVSHEQKCLQNIIKAEIW
jgi:hypothetical protein